MKKVYKYNTLRDKVLQMFAGIIWDRGASGKACKLENVENVGIFRRLWIEKIDGEYMATYCAGQDYTGEIRFIQKLVNR